MEANYSAFLHNEIALPGKSEIAEFRKPYYIRSFTADSVMIFLELGNVVSGITMTISFPGRSYEIHEPPKLNCVRMQLLLVPSDSVVTDEATFGSLLRECSLATPEVCLS